MVPTRSASSCWVSPASDRRAWIECATSELLNGEPPRVLALGMSGLSREPDGLGVTCGAKPSSAFSQICEPWSRLNDRPKSGVAASRTGEAGHVACDGSSNGGAGGHTTRYRFAFPSRRERPMRSWRIERTFPALRRSMPEATCLEVSTVHQRRRRIQSESRLGRSTNSRQARYSPSTSGAGS